MFGIGLEAMPNVFVFMMIYLVPSVIAHLRSHDHARRIFFLNLLLGWTLLGWLIALGWSAWAARTPRSD